MSSLKRTHWPPLQARHPGTTAARRLAVSVLTGAGELLARMAARMAVTDDATAEEPCFEFHAEAGAPEGALYIDGRLVGWIHGVRRL